jgi:hypothetical protein
MKLLKYDAPGMKCGRSKSAKDSAFYLRLTYCLEHTSSDHSHASFHVHTLPYLAAMLDTFEILTTSGVVLWSRSYTAISPAIINSLITNVFIEERTLPGAGIADDISAAKNPPYKHDQHTLKWTTAKELGLIFVVRWQIYQRLYRRTYTNQFSKLGRLQVTSSSIVD